MKTLVLYRSFLGTTKQYADWLKEDLNCDVLKFGEVDDAKLSAYDVIIISSGTYAGWMPLTGFLKKKWRTIKDKKIIIIAVGVAPSDDPFSVQSYEKIPLEVREKIKYFKLFGKMGKIFAPQEIKKDNLKPVFEYIKGI